MIAGRIQGGMRMSVAQSDIQRQVAENLALLDGAATERGRMLKRRKGFDREYLSLVDSLGFDVDLRSTLIGLTALPFYLRAIEDAARLKWQESFQGTEATQRGIDWQSIPWEEIAAFVEAILKIVLMFIGGL